MGIDELAAVRAGLRERIAEVLRTTPARETVTTLIDHTEHHYNAGCALCRGEADTLADAVLLLVEQAVAEQTAQLRAERDQYAAAARHLAFRIREAACTWSRTLPETVRTVDVVQVLLGIASHAPDRPGLRDDLWQRIAGAYEARFENDGHPEDARVAADEAMSVVQPEIDALRADRDRLAAEVAQVRASRDRYRAAWQSAQQRAQAFGEGIQRLCGDRDLWKGWQQAAEAEVAELRARVADAADGITAAVRARKQAEGRAQRAEAEVARLIGVVARYADRGITNGQNTEIATWTAVRAIQLMNDASARRDQYAAEVEQLRARARTLEHVAAGNKRHVQLVVPDLEAAQAAIDRVRALHQPMERAGITNCAHCSGWDGFRCRSLVTPWPCPTLQALDSTEEA